MNKAIDVYEKPRLEQPVLKAKHLRQFDRDFLRASDANPTMRVCEIGCGTGIFLRYLIQRGFSHIFAVDSDTGLAPALSDVTKVDIHLTDAATLLPTLPPASFDRIVLFDVAEHIPLAALCGLMKEIKRLLAPGGRAVMRVPNCSSPWGMKCFFGSFDHVTAFTPERIEELAATTGFRVVRQFGSDTGTGLRKIAQTLLHKALSLCLIYRPDYWEVCLIAVLEPNN